MYRLKRARKRGSAWEALWSWVWHTVSGAGCEVRLGGRHAWSLEEW